jgi:hypothetical protein
VQPLDALRDKAIVALFFGRDSCPHCATPLVDLRKLAAKRSDTAVILVPVRMDPDESKRYFGELYDWFSVPLDGGIGRTLVDRFNISTVPAIVLLDASGRILCKDRRDRIQTDRLGRDFPWCRRPPARMPTVDFDLPQDSRRGALPPPPASMLPPPSTPPPRRFKGAPSASRAPDTVLPAPAIPAGENQAVDLAIHRRAHRGRSAGPPARLETRISSPEEPAAARPPPKPNPSVAAPAITGRNPEDIPQGKHTSLMQPQPLAGVHPFAPTLQKWAHGIPVDCGPDWDWQIIEAAVKRGPHPTARTPESIQLFKEDIEYQIKAGFCRVFLWDDIVRMRPKNLKISPIAVVPQVNRRGRIILDLSFPVYQNVAGVMTVTQQSVNDSTVLQAPSQSVKEIGKVLPRLLQFMHDTDPGLHILFSKLNISDGFWRLIVRCADSFNFAYVLPQLAGEPTRIVVPSAVQMGWVESPTLFCTVTESARDVTQLLIDNQTLLPYHSLENKIKIQAVPRRARTATPTALLQVYVDDFCHATTESTDGTHIPRVRRAAIHAIHSVFPEPAITGHIVGKDPISDRKIEKGDGDFMSTKEMIGFLFDGIKRTVRLPSGKATKYIREIHRVLRRKTVPIKTLQTLVGQLRHASIILPAARGFFTPINTAMKGDPKIIGLGNASEVRAALLDLRSLLKIISTRPTHVRELVIRMPHYVGYHDAAAEGAGGVWFSLVHDMAPFVWRLAFPNDIATDVVSTERPHGKVTNSDLELAAEVLAIGILLAKAPFTKWEPIGTLCDNTPTISWIEKMASKSLSPTAGRLLRGLAFMLHHYHAGRVTAVHVPGQDNIMADIASRPSKAHALFRCATPTLSDPDFLSAFDRMFPLPQQARWAFAMVPLWLKSNVFETLRGKRLDLRLWTGPSGTGIGKRGCNTACSTPRTTTARSPPPPMLATCSSPLLLPCGRESTGSAVRSRFNQSLSRSAVSPKNTFWTDIPTLDVPPPPNTPSTCPLPGS